jgi:hypothetical protein
MSIVWNRRISHIERPVKRRDLPRIRKTFRILEARRRRGLPSRARVPEELWAEALVRSAVKLGYSDQDQVAQAKAKNEFAALRARLLERKREALREVRTRRITLESTCINLWQRRRAWLALARQMGQPAQDLG